MERGRGRGGERERETVCVGTRLPNTHAQRKVCTALGTDVIDEERRKVRRVGSP